MSGARAVGLDANPARSDSGLLHGLVYRVMERTRELYRYRVLVEVLIRRELKARYRGTVLGFLWSFVNPLILMALYVLVFSVYLRVDMPNYPAFLLSGIFPWLWFSSSVNEATLAITSNGGLIRKVYLPSEVFPLVPLGSNMFHFVASLPILFGFLLWAGLTPSWSLLILPVIVGLQVLFTYGIALAVSALVVQFRDLFYIVPNLMTAFFFATPIFYPATMVPERYRILLDVNPLSYLIMAYQDVLFFGRVPSPERLAALAVGSWLVLAAGMAVFDSRKDSFAEEV
ncbi:MAG TPA: ABC transporter permease [Methylomirabilota bacterium]|nr:ABC transporter permease [Methylomirabilota bacterium]